MRKVIFISSLLAVSAAVAATPVQLAAPQGKQFAPVVNVTETPTAQYNEAQDAGRVQISNSGAPSTTASTNGTINPAATTTGTPSASKAPAPTTSLIDTSAMTMGQRVARLEQQMQNLTNMNLPQQIANMQQELQQLQGQLQVQAHDLKLLNQQQRSFYSDLNQRITQLSNLSGSSSNNSTASSAVSQATKNTMKSTSIQIQESNAYQAAFGLLMKKQYSKAQAGFTAYLADYPNGQFQANAHYWLGEIYTFQKNWSQAASEFQTVIKQFPKSNKVADAKLKLAVVHVRQGKIAQATKELNQIQKQHPGSTAAQLASIQLQELAQGN